MIRAFDLHGTITEEPDKYKKLMNIFKDLGDSIWIISGGTTDKIKQELSSIGFTEEDYSKIISVVEFLQDKGHKPISYDDKGGLIFDEKIWWAAKAVICKEYNVGTLVDNEARYGRYFVNNHPTNFIFVKHFGDNGPVFIASTNPLE